MKAIKQKKPVVRGFILCVAAVILVIALLAVGLNLFVCLDSKGRMHSAEDRLNENEYDCIIVLGCGVWGKQPTPLLSDRLDAALTLYKNGAAPKLLMSGDHRDEAVRAGSRRALGRYFSGSRGLFHL